jgi:hypothetical protein
MAAVSQGSAPVDLGMIDTVECQVLRTDRPWTGRSRHCRPAGSCGRIGPAERDRWTLLVRHCTAVCGQVALPGLAPFQYWGPQVGRFSFRLLPSFTEPGGIPAAGSWSA